MSFWEASVAIVAIVFGSGLAVTSIALLRNNRVSKIKKLEERIKVIENLICNDQTKRIENLEKIATENLKNLENGPK